jgi:hypothetical protein
MINIAALNMIMIIITASNGILYFILTNTIMMAPIANASHGLPISSLNTILGMSR